MAVDTCRKPKLMDDDDDEPVVFKRNNTLTKQNRLDADTKRSLSSKQDRQMGRPVPDARSQISPSATVQKSKMISSSKTPGGTRSWNSSSELSAVKSYQVGSKPSTSVTHETKSDKHQIKNEMQSNEVTDEAGKVAEDSEDDKPLSARVLVGSSNSNHASKQRSAAHMPKNSKSEDSDDEVPLSSKFLVKNNGVGSTKNSYTPGEGKTLLVKREQNGSASTDRKPLTISKKRLADTAKSSDESYLKKPKISDAAPAKAPAKPEMKEEDDEDHVPISHRMKKSISFSSEKKSISSEKKSSSAKNLSKPLSVPMKKTGKKSITVVKSSQYSKSSKVPPSSGEGKKWTTLEHNGIIFPPPYKPHGVKMLYKGKPVDLTPEQEEVATMYAGMLDTDYMSKPQFKENFMNDWRKIIGKNHIIQRLEHCDFTPIYDWIQKDKERKKQMTSEEKKAQKEDKLKQEEKYMWAVIDGVKEKVGNFRVEPPGLFRGRGEHPKMGKLKKRIYPSDITINIGKGAKIPECPIPGERWKEVRHDNTVSWLAYWNDPINPKEFKYVFLAASSSLKGQSDKEKYEKARLLKDYILGIREAYTKDFASKDPTKKQIAVATYLIDKLALRAGNEKDEDEADTVGCCTLKFQHVVPAPPNILKFDFKGKDSIDYRNDVEVETAVFKAIQQFRNGKKKDDALFDKLDTSKLNAHLKELMPGLTAKVFRTYNASITLDDKLSSETKGGDATHKMLVYQHANKEVAIICNHQRTVSKNHGAQMTRLNEKIEELKAEVKELKKDLSRAREGKPPLKSPDGKSKKNFNPEVLAKRIAKITATIEAKERDKETKEDLKTVALGTSKINYLDPRITVAWCKRHEVPIEKMFNKSLLAKFAWAMDVDPSFRF